LSAAILAALAATAPARAADDATLKAILGRLERLEARLGNEAPPAATGSEADTLAQLTQRLAILERKLELADEAAATRATTTSTVALSDKGLAAKSADGAYELK